MDKRRGCGWRPRRRTKASRKLWEGGVDAQHAFGDLDGHRPALLGVHDALGDGTAYRTELSVRVDEAVLSDDPILRHDLQLPDSWWAELAGTLEKAVAFGTDRVAVRQQYMGSSGPGPGSGLTCWTTAHSDVLDEPHRLAPAAFGRGGTGPRSRGL
ncbi:hypothetical protein [Streptomyces sp. NPDC054804]